MHKREKFCWLFLFLECIVSEAVHVFVNILLTFNDSLLVFMVLFIFTTRLEIKSGVVCSLKDL